MSNTPSLLTRFLENYESLVSAWTKAGGMNPTPQMLRSMSALEFLESLAKNSIQVFFLEEDDNKDSFNNRGTSTRFDEHVNRLCAKAAGFRIKRKMFNSSGLIVWIDNCPISFNPVADADDRKVLAKALGIQVVCSYSEEVGSEVIRAYSQEANAYYQTKAEDFDCRDSAESYAVCQLACFIATRDESDSHFYRPL